MEHWASRKCICKKISGLQVRQSKKVENIGVYTSCYTPKQKKSQFVNLTGRKSTVNCFLFDMNWKILLDKNFHIRKSES